MTKKTLYLILAALILITTQSQARNSYYAVSMDDSLMTSASSALIHNNIYVYNKGNRTIPLDIVVEYPEDWRLLGPAAHSITLRPGGQEVLPLALARLPKTEAVWQQVRIRISRRYTYDTIDFYFHVKAAPKRQFTLSTYAGNELYFSENQDVQELRVKLRNTGNTEERYELNWRNALLARTDVQSLTLPPLTDTLVRFRVALTAAEIQALKSEPLTCQVTDGHSRRSVVFHVRNISSVKKVNPSAYNTAKLSLYSSLLSYGNTGLTYNLGGNASVRINEDASLDLLYRSKQYGIMNRYEQNIFNLNFRYKNWTLSAGQVLSGKYFLSYGNGFRITRAGKTEFSVWGNKHYANAFQKNDNAGLSLSYQLGKTVISNSAAVNIDHLTGRYSALVDNEVKLADNERLKATLTAGAGKDFFPGAGTGLSLGYALRYQLPGRLTLTSNMLSNGDAYPGIYRGLKRYYHELRWLSGKRTSLAAFYQYNAITQNFYRDSLFNTDAFSYNLERYGIRSSFGGRKMGVSLAVGLMQQNGTRMALPRYQFVELNYRYRAGKTFYLNLSSLNGYAGNVDNRQDPAWITNSNLSLSHKWGGVTASFVRTSYKYREAGQTEREVRFNETVNLTPYLTFQLGKTLQIGINYSLAKLLQNEMVTHYLGGSINYSGLRNGLTVALNTSMPLRPDPNDRYSGFYNLNYFNLMVTKNLNVPLPFRKKYHTIRMHAFFDENNNGVRDGKEQPLDDLLVTLNDVPFKTNKQGQAVYMHVDPGPYNVDLSGNPTLKGMLPSGGMVQQIDLQSNTTHAIAYKKARTISGRVRVTLDTNRNSGFTPDRIKVLLIGDNGYTNATITDEDGNYSFNAPEGVYQVSLNREAFSDEYRPVRAAFPADLVRNEQVEVNFEIRQKKREVRMKTFDLD